MEIVLGTDMWSAVHRKNRHIFELIDTNMLIEAWHHVLKGKFMKGRRNRRMDHLLHILIDEVVPYYAQKQLRQRHGFEGLNLEMKRRRDVIAAAESIPADAVHVRVFQSRPAASLKLTPSSPQVNDAAIPTFRVASQSKAGTFYDVDLDAYTCTCPSFPLISYCKHLAATERHTTPREDPTRDIPAEEDAAQREMQAARVGVEGLGIATDTEATTTGAPASSSTIPTQTSSASTAWEQLGTQVQAIFNRPASDYNIDPTLLAELKQTVDRIASTSNAPATTSGSSSVLPKPIRIPPNILNKTETQRVLPRAKETKSSKKRHLDPYSGGERAGKRAKEDARRPLEPPKQPTSTMARSEDRQPLAATQR